MDRQAVLEKTRKELRSVLISAPRGVPTRMLLKDYKMVTGKELPYRQLGFSSLEDFIHSQSDVVRVGMGPTGEPTFYGVANAETAQISRFVASQKKTKLKKSLAPPPVVARTPVKMAAFTRKFRYGPRFSPKGGPNHRVGRPVRQYPRSPSSPGSYNMQPPRANFQPRFHTHREVYPSGTFSYSRASTAQNFHVHVPNPQPSSSSFHHRSSLQDLEGRKSPPRQRLGSLPTDTSSPPRTASGIPPWKKEFEKATEMSIQQLHSKINWNFNHTVCVTGYSSGKHLEETTKDGTLSRKFLLYSQYKKGKPQLPGVMLYFRQPFWDLREYPDPLHLGEGVKLKVYGGPFVQFSKKKGVGEPACTVKFYEKLSDASSSASSSAHTSPQGSRSMSPKLVESTKRPQSLDIKSGSLEDKVFKLLKGFPNGVWGKRLDKEFEAKFHQPPPPDLLHRAKIMPFVKWEELAEDMPILYPKQEYYSSEHKEEPGPEPKPLQSKPTDTVTPTSPSSWTPKECATSTGRRQTSSQSSRTLPTSPSSHPSRVVHAQPLSQPVRTSPPPLPSTVEFAGGEELFDVYVCHVNSPVSFYVQVAENGSFEKFLAMEEELNKHYSSKAEPATSVSVNHLYCYNWEGDEGEDSQWCRMLVVAVRKNKADVMFPDYGNTVTVSCCDVKQLPERFQTLPFQAIHCCLHGITESDEELCEKFSELAVGKNCVANVMDRSGSRVSVELIVSESDCQETINSLLMKALHPISTLTPQLPTPGSPLVPVTLTEVDEDGVISIQLMGPGLNRLQQLMNEINDAYSKPKSKASDFVSKVSEGMAGCAKFSIDGNWYRVVVKKILERKSLSQKLLVEYVDYGNEEEIDRFKLRRALDTELYSLPHQAVKCSLHGLPPPQGEWTEDAVGTVSEYVECEDIQLEVIESQSDHRLAAVRLFVKSGEEIASLNDMLLAQPSLFGLSDPNMEEVFIEEEEEDFAYGGIETSSVSSSRSSRVSDGPPEDPLVTSQGGPLLAAKELGNKVTKENVVNKDIHDKVGQLSLEEGRKCLPGGAEPQSGIAVAAAPCTAEAMFDRHSLPTNLASSRNVAHEIVSSPSSAVSVSHVPEIVEQQRSVSIEIGPITPATSDLEPSYSASPHTPMFSPPGPATSIEAKLNNSRSSSYLQPYTPSNSPSPCSSPLRHDGRTPVRGGGEMRFESLIPLKHVPVNVSWADSPEDFVVQLLSKYDELEQMMVNLNMTVVGHPPLSSADIFPGLLCCASSSIDKRWYRAVVISAHNVSGVGDITVEFLDYGGSEPVSLVSVKALPGNFLELPFQGIHCSLKRVSPSSGTWSSAALNYFNLRVVGYPLYAIEHSKGPATSVVFLLDTSVIPTVIINDEIVEQHHAVRDDRS